MPNRFFFDLEGDEQSENDDVIGCAIGSNDKRCFCVVCGNEDCIYRGSLRCEVEEVA